MRAALLPPMTAHCGSRYRRQFVFAAPVLVEGRAAVSVEQISLGDITAALYIAEFLVRLYRWHTGR